MCSVVGAGVGNGGGVAGSVGRAGIAGPITGFSILRYILDGLVVRVVDLRPRGRGFEA